MEIFQNKAWNVFKETMWDFPVVQTSSSNPGGMGFIPGQRAEIPKYLRAETPKHKVEAVF